MKLAGLRVLDLGLYLPTPVVTQMMADHGADVISIEPPGGDPTRQLAGEGAGGESLWFDAMHRGKRSVVADLKTDAGKALVRRLAAEADVFIESFRPGIAARLGIDAATLRADNPRLVYCSLSAYGQSGPLSALSGHDMAVQSWAGFVSLNRRPGELPVVPGAPTADMVSGMSALSAILMALYRREQTGRGDAIDIAMYDSLLAWTPHFQSFAATFGDEEQARLEAAVSGSAFYNIYATKDGGAIALAGLEPHYIRNFLDAVERLDLLDDAMGDPGQGQERVMAELRRLFASRDQSEWCDFLSALNVSWAPVLAMADAFRHPHALARGVIAVGENASSPATPLKFQDEPAVKTGPAPALDEHGPQIAARGFG
ncbi:MAG TPA: CoA transferase [Sphingobium sp.]|nr:CoA transferase [Sphingobium sp.]